MNIAYLVIGFVIGMLLAGIFSALIVSIMLKKSNEMGNSKAGFDDFAMGPLHNYSGYGSKGMKGGNPFEASFTGRVGNHDIGDGLDLLKHQYFK